MISLWRLRFRVWGLGFRVWSLGFRGWSLGFGAYLRFRVWGYRILVESPPLKFESHMETEIGHEMAAGNRDLLP